MDEIGVVKGGREAVVGVPFARGRPIAEAEPVPMSVGSV